MATALVIIDMQMMMQQRIDTGRDCVNSDASTRIAELTDVFRQRGRPIIHIRHRDDDPTSPLHPEAPGYQPMPCAESRENEAVFHKRTSSAFASTDLEAHLRKHAITNLIVTGAVAGFCVSSTVRAGADLGFEITVIRDAVLGFDLPSVNLSARPVFDVTMAHLEADFAKVVETSSILSFF